MLIEKGVDVNCKDKQGNTALMVAAKKNPKENVRLIQMLIEKGGNVDDVNNEGDCFYSLLGKEAVKNGFVSGGNNDIKDHEDVISENKRKVGVKDFVIFFIIPFMILLMSSKLIK
jgi:ankyrin repeat protein